MRSLLLSLLLPLLHRESNKSCQNTKWCNYETSQTQMSQLFWPLIIRHKHYRFNRIPHTQRQTFSKTVTKNFPTRKSRILNMIHTDYHGHSKWLTSYNPPWHWLCVCRHSLHWHRHNRRHNLWHSAKSELSASYLLISQIFFTSTWQNSVHWLPLSTLTLLVGQQKWHLACNGPTT